VEHVCAARWEENGCACEEEKVAWQKSVRELPAESLEVLLLLRRNRVRTRHFKFLSFHKREDTFLTVPFRM
jgi:hypothetical protein